MNPEVNKELIFRYFSGDATAFQKQVIEEWAQDLYNREQFYIWLQNWEQLNSQYSADVEKGISRHWSRMNHSETRIHNLIKEKNASKLVPESDNRYKFNWLACASVILIILACGWVFRDAFQYKYYNTDFSETKRIQLSDGSKVVLNSNSSLKVPRFGFGQQTREVVIQGEADFDIAHTKDNNRFIVKTDKGLEVEVLGTKFNVYTRPRGTRIALNKGKVQLHYQEGQEQKLLTMKPGDFVTMDTNGRANLIKTENPQKFSAWKAHRYIFEKTTLQEVCNLFEDNFGIQVQIPDSSLAMLTISGSFTALNAEELLGILTDDSGLNYKKSEDGKNIILTY